ncbi:discoidin/SUN/FTP domain-containing protein [Tessaracoccus sp. MC1679]|uniref:hypothetical protein n=1 Tax=Tessaracoccus sp. MC1679 TaxID=2760313 RepID=UPI0015FF6B57|nr:hypothetical protein [Tessaracoccus sp. MC1679]MBB1515456.1 hypothetical protein [Tessaracoccus sp. MC1679]
MIRSRLTVTPRQSGSNGRIRGYEVLVGDDPSSLVSVAAGTLPNSSDPSVIPLTGSGDLVRLRVLSTYGDQADRWVSTAELSVTRLIADSRPGTRR